MSKSKQDNSTLKFNSWEFAENVKSRDSNFTASIFFFFKWQLTSGCTDKIIPLILGRFHITYGIVNLPLLELYTRPSFSLERQKLNLMIKCHCLRFISVKFSKFAVR